MAAVAVSHPSPFHPSPIRHLSPLLSQTLNEASTPFSFFILPDLVSYCAFPLSSQPNANRIATHSTNWLVEGSSELSPRRRAALQSLKAGQLTSLCYPSAPDDRFRIICDFIGFLFHLDDISDGMMKKETDALGDLVMNALWFPDRYIPCQKQPAEEQDAGKLARDYWSRCIQDAGPGVQHRFKESMQLFFEAVNNQASERDNGTIPEMNKYIALRRDNGGCKAAFVLIEYGLGIDLPDFVVEHPVIEALNKETNDFVAWSNDIYSWNVEQARGDTANMVTVVMQHCHLGLQQAIDYVGALCCRSIDRFMEKKALLPKWESEKLNKDVQNYVKGLEDWIVGSLHFNFLTDRYFGKNGNLVKMTRVVKIMEAKVRNL